MKKKAVVVEDYGRTAQADSHEDGAQLESPEKVAPELPKQPNAPSVSA